MTWQEAIKRSPEDTAVLHRGNYVYLRYPNGSTFHAYAKTYRIIEKCHSSVDGNWEPLYDKVTAVLGL